MGLTNQLLTKKRHLKRLHRLLKTKLGTNWELYPIYGMNSCINSRGEATIILSLDANSACRSLMIDRSDHDSNEFKSHQRLHHFLFMSFRLQNAPEKFRRTVSVNFCRLKRYLDFRSRVVSLYLYALQNVNCTKDVLDIGESNTLYSEPVDCTRVSG